MRQDMIKVLLLIAYGSYMQVDGTCSTRIIR
jgi:hypothetical protein